MLRCSYAALLGAGLLAACSPTLNWREVQVETTALKAMMPCKPDKALRSVPMAGRQVELHALACDAGGANFALLFADIADASRADEVLGQWNAASLANLRSDSAQESAFRPAGALALPHSQQVVAGGRRPDGSKVQSRAAYFAQGRHVFQAVVYADEVKPEMADPFFSGLKLQ